MAAALRGRHQVSLAELRAPGALMLAVATALPQLPLPSPACPLRSLTGIPCPLCGMTTSVVAAATLDLPAALAANVAGVAAVALAVVLLARPRATTLSVPGGAVPAALLLLWAQQLARFSVL